MVWVIGANGMLGSELCEQLKSVEMPHIGTDVDVNILDIDAMRAFAQGKPVESAFNKRVISMQLEQLRQVDYSIGVAGGRRKFDAIQGALNGRWINVLVTDRDTAEQLMR